MFVGFWAEDVAVEAPGKYHVQPVGLPVDKSVKSIQSPIHKVLSDAPKSADTPVQLLIVTVTGTK